MEENKASGTVKVLKEESRNVEKGEEKDGESD